MSPRSRILVMAGLRAEGSGGGAPTVPTVEWGERKRQSGGLPKAGWDERRATGVGRLRHGSNFGYLKMVVVEAGEDGAGEGFGFGGSDGFFGDAAHADAEEEAALQDVQRARQRAADPVGFFAERGDWARFTGVVFGFAIRGGFGLKGFARGTKCRLLRAFARSGLPFLFLLVW